MVNHGGHSESLHEKPTQRGTRGKIVDNQQDHRPDPREKAWAEGRHPRPLNEGRSNNMRAIRRTGTKPEVRLRAALHRLGYRFRKDYRVDLPSVRARPDIVFTRRKVAVFVDGCFWHCCPEHGRNPEINTWYWSPKLRRNVERDALVTSALQAAGWTVLRIWEHEDTEQALTRITQAL